MKPRVVALGHPQYAGADYIAEFQKEFNFSVLDASHRAETQQMLPEDIAANGPIDAFLIRMGTPPYEPFDQDLLRALVPDCKIIVSASAGYNEFDVQWMADEGIWFCNTVNAVAEATADMALFLILAVLRNTTNAEKSARNGTWRTPHGGDLVPARDPAGLTLGIVGMGAIGKVRGLSFYGKQPCINTFPLAYRQKGRLLQHEDRLS
jgi:lactate dehydrogenase-like 2-hydroxyacid dehydrogenase